MVSAGKFPTTRQLLALTINGGRLISNRKYPFRRSVVSRKERKRMDVIGDLQGGGASEGGAVTKGALPSVCRNSALASYPSVESL